MFSQPKWHAKFLASQCHHLCCIRMTGRFHFITQLGENSSPHWTEASLTVPMSLAHPQDGLWCFAGNVSVVDPHETCLFKWQNFQPLQLWSTNLASLSTGRITFWVVISTQCVPLVCNELDCWSLWVCWGVRVLAFSKGLTAIFLANWAGAHQNTSVGSSRPIFCPFRGLIS